MSNIIRPFVLLVKIQKEGYGEGSISAVFKSNGYDHDIT